MTPTDTIDLTGRCALVTGGASGIGEEVARLLVDLGARVAIANRTGPSIEAAMARSGAHHAIVGDVTIEADAERMAAETAGAFGGLDLLVNSAGIGDDLVPLHEQSAQRWKEVTDVNLWGTYLVCRAAGRIMLEARRGSVVNISSTVGIGAFPGRSAYGAAKAGVIHLTRTLGVEWGPSGVRVNAVAPSYTLTPMVTERLQRGLFDPAALERRTPLGRMARPVEIARAVAFLSSDWASYVTATVLPVDGGWTAFGAAGDVGTIRTGGNDRDRHG
jgi:NAD(P)-dependent dehydrogenase (short-subunit alcohol dehydrogenase family)